MPQKFMIIRKNEYYRSRKFIFAINTQNDFWMILVSALMGIGLSFIVGWPLLIMGLYCYLIGIFYSSGPKPLSSLPLGKFSQDLQWGS